METTRQYLSRRVKSLKDERNSWEPSWRDVAEYLHPRNSRFLVSDANKGNRQSRNTNKIVDTTAVYALRTLSSGMMSGITSPARPWFRLTVPDPELNDMTPVRSWLYQVETRMREVFSRSNLYNVLPQVYTSLGAFGTGAMAVMEHKDDVIRCFPFPIGSYSISNNADLRVDTFVREFRMTVRQLVSDFGLEKCSDRVQKAYKDRKLEQWIDVIQLVEPNWNMQHGREDHAGKPYRSIYYEKAGDGEKMLRVKGFDEFPVLCPRWEVTGEDVYGEGPGQLSLGDVKQLQLETRRKSQGIEKMVNPPMIGDVSLKRRRTSVLPGDVTYVDMAANPNVGFRPAYEVSLPLADLTRDIAEIQQRINSSFYVDLFLMLSQSDRRQITAREIEERHEEKLLMLGPVLERIEDELLDPLISRVFSIMVRKGLFPDPPEEIQGIDLRVEYQSILAQAQKLVGIQGINRLTEYVASLAQIKPESLDMLDADKAVEAYAEALGTPPDLLRDIQDVVQERQAKAEAAQMAQQMEAASQGAAMAKDGAGAIKDASQARMGEDNALDRMLRGMGQ